MIFFVKNQAEKEQRKQWLETEHSRDLLKVFDGVVRNREETLHRMQVNRSICFGKLFEDDPCHSETIQAPRALARSGRWLSESGRRGPNPSTAKTRVPGRRPAPRSMRTK